MPEGPFGGESSKVQNQVVRDSMTFLGTVRYLIQFVLTGRGWRSKRQHWASPPQSANLQRGPRSLGFPSTGGLSGVVGATAAYNKKGASSLKTPHSNSNSSCRQIQREHFGHLSLAIKTGSWCPDIMIMLHIPRRCMLGLRACQKPYTFSRLILAQWTHLRGT